MAGDEGAQSPVQYDSMDQAAMDQVQREQVIAQAIGRMPLIGNTLGPAMAADNARDIAEIQDRANKKAELAQAVNSGATMRVDPAEVDALAKFFEDEAQGLIDRMANVQDLALVDAPGADPVSSRAATVYGSVAAGDDRAYADNYMKLVDVFKTTAANLRSSAQQTRTNDQDAKDSFEGGDFA